MFGELVKKNRQLLGLTQAQLAEKLDISEHTINLVENGSCSPTEEILNKLSNSLYINTRDHMKTENTVPYDKSYHLSSHQKLSIVLSALEAGLDVEIGIIKFVKYGDTIFTKNPRTRLYEGSLNDFIELCESLSDAECAVITSNCVLTKMAK